VIISSGHILLIFGRIAPTLKRELDLNILREAEALTGRYGAMRVDGVITTIRVLAMSA